MEKQRYFCLVPKKHFGVRIQRLPFVLGGEDISLFESGRWVLFFENVGFFWAGGGGSNNKSYPRAKLTFPPKRDNFKRNLHLPSIDFRYVSFQGCNFG